MASYKSHIDGGIFAFAVFLFIVSSYFSFEWWQVPVWLGISVLAALFPDIDTKSFIQKIAYHILFVVDLILILLERYLDAALLGAVLIIPIISKHRGWTHTLRAALLVPLPLLLIRLKLTDGYIIGGPSYYFAGVLGYMSHLVMDRKYKY